MNPRHALAVALALTLAACAGRWEHATTPRERWADDERSCTVEADREVERLTRGERLSAGDPTLGRGGYEQGMARLDAARLQRSLVERCMTDRGYVRGRTAPR